MAHPTTPLSPQSAKRRSKRTHIIFASAILVFLASLAVLAGWIFFHGLIPATPSPRPIVGDFPEAPLIREWGTLRNRYLLPYKEPIFDIATLLASLVLVALAIRTGQFFRQLAANQRERLARYERELDTNDFLKVKNDLRATNIQLMATIAQIVGGIVLLCGIYFAWKNLVTTREGQITDRFIRAIDQLGATNRDGSPQREIRLGGIYGLERIAWESDEDRSSISEILEGYIQVNARWPSDEAANEQAHLTASAPEIRIHPQIDIQTALHFVVHPQALQILHLNDLDLRGANLFIADLDLAILSYTHLDGATMDFATMSLARLNESHLDGASMKGAQMRMADLRHSHLEYVDFSDANLDGALLNAASLNGAIVTNASLMYAHLGDTDLNKVRGLTQKQIDSAYGNLKTILPSELHMPESWKTKGDRGLSLRLSEPPF